MKTGALFALLGELFAVAGTGSLAPLALSSPSSLMLVGLGGLALLTLRSERWRTAQ